MILPWLAHQRAGELQPARHAARELAPRTAAFARAG
jgi:hypothetical protein